MKLDSKEANFLFQALVEIKNLEEAKMLLEDLCTMGEIEAFIQRLQAAKRLLKGQTYDQIMQETDISSATLSRVSKCIRYGEGGYKTIIDKIKD